MHQSQLNQSQLYQSQFEFTETYKQSNNIPVLHLCSVIICTHVPVFITIKSGLTFYINGFISHGITQVYDVTVI